MNITYVFPGQGSQKKGMIRALGRNAERVRDVFEMASDLAGRDVLELCTSADEETLGQTRNTQIAVTAMNMAFLRVLQLEGIDPDIVLGQSLGQFSAMVAAGAMTMENTFRLVVRRAELMSGIQRSGCMCSILGLELGTVEEILHRVPAELGTLEIALQNARTQIVLGGDEPAVSRAAELSREAGAFKTVQVQVSAAFHTSLMKEIEADLADFVDSLPMEEPKCRMILNCKGDFADSAADIREDLKRATCHRVLWAQGLTRLLEEKDLLIAEAGIGRKMAGMIRNMEYRGKVYLLSEARDCHYYILAAREEADRRRKEEG